MHELCYIVLYIQLPAIHFFYFISPTVIFLHYIIIITITRLQGYEVQGENGEGQKHR